MRKATPAKATKPKAGTAASTKRAAEPARPAKVGRPTKLTPDVQATICGAIERGATYEIAAALAGVRRSTIYNWLGAGENEESGAHAEFLDAVKAAEARCAMTALDTVRTGGMGWQSSAWILERRFSDGYRQQKAHEHSGPNGGPISFTALHEAAGS